MDRTTAKQRELVVISETTLQTVPRTVVRVLQELETDMEVPGPYFETIKDWYKTLGEIISDAANVLFKRHLQAPSVLEVSQDVLTFLELAMDYEANGKINQNDEILPLTRGKWVGTLNNRLKVVLVDNMLANEACVVLITNVKITAGKHVEDPHKPLSFPPEEAQKPLLPQVDLIPLQRLDEFTIHVLDMFL